MTRQEAAQNIHNMRQYKKEVTSSKESAIEALIRAGILNKQGEIAEPYKQLFSGNVMGYYTEHLVHRPVGMTELEFEDFHNQLERISGYNWIDGWNESNDKDTVLGLTPEEGPIKWYDYMDHMREISKLFPNYLTILDGAGEESDDIWRAFFKDGKAYSVPAQITFPGFDENLLT